MKRICSLSLMLVCCLAVITRSAETAGGVGALNKKLIEYGWGVPTPDFIRGHIREMEQRPFDGLIFRLNAGRNVLEPVAWDEAKFAKDFEDLREIKWEKFTDNFVIMLAASKQDWFNDDHWRAIENNVRLVARAAKIGRCVGICFDQEPYGDNPWAYTKAAHRDTKSFSEYEAIVRRRAGQFIRAVEGEFPKPKILTFFQLSLFGSLLVPMNPQERSAKLSQQHYALLPAFLNGMLDAAGPDAVIIDGNENAYYYTDSRQHLDVYHMITQRGLYLIDPALWPKYRAQVQAGQALYIDQYFGLRTNKVLGHYMTPEERPKWFEHNVYWAMYTADRYVWCYSERMNWWTNKDIPPGCEQAVVSALAKLKSGQKLGFDLKPIVEAAAARQRAAPMVPKK
jgi:hypothetical protein